MVWLFLPLFAVYSYYFFLSVRDYWFNPLYTTDDSLQQLFPFYEAIYPGIFQNDIVTESMRLYLSPLHYWLGYHLTALVGDPNIAGHYLHLVQLLSCMLFLFLLVRKLSSTGAAFFSLIWFLHTRNLVQRMTCGLPRGWAGVVITAFLYFLVARNHYAILATLLVGALLNPPATFLCAFTYGAFLVYECASEYYRSRSFHSEQFQDAKRTFIRYAVFAPLLVGVTYWGIARPPEIGRMATYQEAAQMSGFSRNGGRFPFVPLKTAITEINSVGMQAFINRWHKPALFFRHNIIWIVTGTLLLLLVVQLRLRRELLPPELLIFLASALTVYFLSRLFAFRLYVPDRHLQFPLNIFHIAMFSVAFWRLGYSSMRPHSRKESNFRAIRGSASLLILGSAILYLGGTGLEGTANFNTRTDRSKDFHQFIKTSTDPLSTIAGHPSRLDGIQLFGIRKGYITTETAHPFYDQYYKEVLRRLQVSFRAYFARSEEELVEQLGSEKIDYFVFFDYDFTPERLKKGSYDHPYKVWYRRLAERSPRSELLFAKLPQSLSTEFPYLVYRDLEAAVIDVSKLKEFVTKKHTGAENSK